MSRLREMIRELCPDGVEYKPLGEISEILDNQRKPVTKKDRVIGQYPYYGANGIQDYVNRYIFDGTFLLVGEDGSVVTEQGAPVVHWATGRIWVNNHAHILQEKDGVSLRFLFHYMQTLNICHLVKGVPPKLNQKNLREIEIPVPPLPIQNEIVKLLDNFTELTAELTAELVLRKKQYNFYRDSLLNFVRVDDTIVRTDRQAQRIGKIGLLNESVEVEWKRLGMIGDVTKLAGFEFTKFVTYVEHGEIIALRGLNVKGNLDLTDVKYVDGSDFSKLERSKLYKDDLLFTYVGTVGQVALVDCDDRYYLAPNVARIRFDTAFVVPAYMRYYFQTGQFMKMQIEKYAKISSMKNLTMENIRKFTVPIPPLEVQAKIVSILDRFDTLCNDLTQGLPAEIAARRKQYEYYRDKLLTFHRKGA